MRMYTNDNIWNVLQMQSNDHSDYYIVFHKSNTNVALG